MNIGCPVQYSGLENSVGCLVRGVAKSQTWLSDFHFPHPHTWTASPIMDPPPPKWDIY